MERAKAEQKQDRGRERAEPLIPLLPHRRGPAPAGTTTVRERWYLDRLPSRQVLARIRIVNHEAADGFVVQGLAAVVPQRPEQVEHADEWNKP